MYQRQKFDEPDILRARFTTWLEKLVKNAKIDYLRQFKNAPETISIDDLFEDEQLIGDNDVAIPEQKTAFDFEEERLNKNYVYALINKGLLRSTKLGCRKVTRKALMEFLEKNDGLDFDEILATKPTK